MNGQFVLLDAGGFCSVKSREQALLSEYFMKCMKVLNYSAVLVAANEMKHGLDFIKRVNQEANLPLLSSNIVYLDGKPVFFTGGR